MSFRKLDKKYVSEIDQFLVEFDKQHPEASASQQYEKQKYARITRLMKNPDADNHQPENTLWEGFNEK